jgi:NaMN:DMB phosphoribosyltransferase
MTQAAQDKLEILNLIRGFSALPSTACENPIHSWVRRGQQSCAPQMTHPRLSMIIAAHGFAETSEVETHSSFINDVTGGRTLLNELCVAANTDLRLYDMDLTHPTENCFEQNVTASCSDDTFVRAIAYGMMAVEPGLDIMAAFATGPGSTMSARALIALHTLEKTKNNVHDMLTEKLVNKAQSARGLDALQKIGGFEMAALCGLITAARLANCSVLVTGITAASTLWCLSHDNKNILDHCAYLDHPSRDYALPENLVILKSPYETPQDDGSSLAAFLTHLRVTLLLETHKHAPKLASAA